MWSLLHHLAVEMKKITDWKQAKALRKSRISKAVIIRIKKKYLETQNKRTHWRKIFYDNLKVPQHVDL